MTPDKYLDKAAHALRSARLLLDAGEIEGACNRAYYAMFNAAHAALLFSGAHSHPAETKKHNGLISAFGKHLVLTGLVSSELGKALNRVESIRILADYTGEDIAPDKAVEIVDLAMIFLVTIEKTFPRHRPSASACAPEAKT